MAETIKLLKGLKANLPSSEATPGAMYCCTDTGGIYIANSSGVPQLIANIDTGATSTGSSGSGNAVTSLSYNTSTRKLTYNLGNSFLPLAGGNLTGHIYLTGAKATNSTSNTSQIVFGTQADNHIAISSNTNALVLNPSTSDPTNQIILYLDKSSLFPKGITGNLTGNADTATKFAAAQTVALTGDITGSVSSQAGWSIATTLKNSGVTAGSYGPSTNASPEHGKTFSVPYFTVDAKGRVTAASTKTITLPGINNVTISVAAGKGLTDGGSFTTNQGTAGIITLNVGAGTGISVTDNAVSLSTSGVSAGSYGPSANAFPVHGGTFSVPYITTDAYGRITAASTKTITLPTYSLSSFGITVTSTELNYVDGVTSNIQTQLNGKQASGNYAVITAGNTFNGEQKMLNSSYCPTMNDIASGVGCSLKNSRACDNQLIVAEIWAPTTAVTDSTINMSSVVGEIAFYHGGSGSGGQFASKTLLGKINSNGWVGNVQGNASTATNVAWSGVTSKPSYYDAKAIKSITRNGTTFTYTCMDGTTGTFTQQDNNTTYNAASQSTAGLMSAADKKKLDGIATGANNYTYTLPAATSSALGGVKVGSNITNSSGTISLTKANVTAALGYTPPTTDTNTHYTTKLFATNSSGTAHAATTNGNTYLRLFDDSTARQSIKIIGSGATTVSSDGSGTITISSTDTKNAGTITAVQANGTNVATSGTANIPAASTSAYGVTKLSSATNSTSTTLAATASAVKAAYDLANSKAPGYTYGTTDLTAGVSELATGTLYFVYE